MSVLGVLAISTTCVRHSAFIGALEARQKIKMMTF